MNLVIFGPQGCGKGTQALKLAKKYNLAHIEAGHIFREIAKEDTALGKMVHDLIHVQVRLIPDAVAVEILETYLKKVPVNEGVIIDGAPRTLGQIGPIENMLERIGRPLDKAIHITLPYEQSVERMSKRYRCSQCRKDLVLGKDIQSGESPCPQCGGRITQREDDTPEGIKKRLKDFHKITMPVIEHYREKGMLIEADGNQSREKVFEDIIKKL